MWAKIRWDRAFARPANATPGYNPSKTAPNGLQTGRITLWSAPAERSGDGAFGRVVLGSRFLDFLPKAHL